MSCNELGMTARHDATRTFATSDDVAPAIRRTRALEIAELPHRRLMPRDGGQVVCSAKKRTKCVLRRGMTPEAAWSDVAEPSRGVVPRGMLELRSLLCWGGFVLSLVGCSYPELPRLTDADAPPGNGTFPSCQGLPKTCGLNGDDDCCTSFEVQGGRFFRGYDLAGTRGPASITFPRSSAAFAWTI